MENIESRIDVLRYSRTNEAFPNNFTPQILDAIAEDRLLEIEYFSAYKESSSVRQVEPVNLLHYSMHWHLIAWCRERNDLRDFRLDRIHSLTALNEHFTKRKLQSSEEFLQRMMETAHLIEAKVRFNKPLLNFIAQTRFYYGFMSETAVGDQIEMTFAINSLEYLASWLITLGDELDIVQPPELKDILQERVRVLSGKYL